MKLYFSEFPPDTQSEEIFLCRSRMSTAVEKFCKNTQRAHFMLTVSTEPMLSTRDHKNVNAKNEHDDLHIAHRAKVFISKQPLYSFKQLILSEQTLNALIAAVDYIKVQDTVFNTWKLRDIEPFPRSCLNFHGLPGTGKTLAAHAVASRLGRPIMSASYAEVESKFHGDGPKNIKALFYAAERDAAVLFIDEADSLLSRRLTNVSQGSEQAINSMRSQLLISLEQFTGIVVFATNLIGNYDKAFESRIKNILFEMPDLPCREAIWQKHLLASLPQGECVTTAELAQIENLSGRDIKNAVIDAAIRVALAGRDAVLQQDIIDAVTSIQQARQYSEPLTIDTSQMQKGIANFTANITRG